MKIIKYILIDQHSIPLLYYKNKRAKKICIRINEEAEIKISIPYNISFFLAEKFVHQNKKWIINSYKKRKNELQKNKTIFNETNTFQTRFHKFTIKKDHLDRQNIIKTYSNTITISFPYSINILNETSQQFIRSIIIKILRKEAKMYLPERVDYYAKKYNLTYQNVFIKNNKTRWGSCSGKNNINLNLHLMRLPENLSDYIILHELTHTIHKNHSKKFWDALEYFSGNAKLLSSELKKFSIVNF